MKSVDILMITYDSPRATELSLSRLLETCDEHMRVWIWHNGNHEATLATVRRLLDHPRVYRFHHSPENKRLWEPTNWLFANADADFLSKVDDDNVLPMGWAETLRAAHTDEPRFGVIGCWRFPEEDFVPELADKKIRSFTGGHRLLQNLWTEGSCFLMKRQCRDEQGLLRPGESFPAYCRRLAMRGWINGWYYPFVRYENLDDPRSPNTLIRTEEDLREHLPLTAQYNGVATVQDWVEQLRRSAHVSQAASPDIKQWTGWRWLLRRARTRARRALGSRRHW